MQYAFKKHAQIFDLLFLAPFSRISFECLLMLMMVCGSKETED